MSATGPGWAPEACTLPTADRPLRVVEFDDLFSAALLSQDRTAPTVLTWSLAPGAEQTARDLTRRESACCSFFAFGFHPAEDGFAVTVEVPPSRVDVLDALEQRAAEQMQVGR